MVAWGREKRPQRYRGSVRHERLPRRHARPAAPNAGRAARVADRIARHVDRYPRRRRRPAPRDVVGHLISGELDDWIPRTERIPRAWHREGLRPVRPLRPRGARRRDAARGPDRPVRSRCGPTTWLQLDARQPEDNRPHWLASVARRGDPPPAPRDMGRARPRPRLAGLRRSRRLVRCRGRSLDGVPRHPAPSR